MNINSMKPLMSFRLTELFGPKRVYRSPAISYRYLLIMYVSFRVLVYGCFVEWHDQFDFEGKLIKLA